MFIQNEFLLFTPKSPKGDFLSVLQKSPLGDLGVNEMKLF